MFHSQFLMSFSFEQIESFHFDHFFQLIFLKYISHFKYILFLFFWNLRKLTAIGGIWWKNIFFNAWISSIQYAWVNDLPITIFGFRAGISFSNEYFICDKGSVHWLRMQQLKVIFELVIAFEVSLLHKIPPDYQIFNQSKYQMNVWTMYPLGTIQKFTCVKWTPKIYVVCVGFGLKTSIRIL